MLRAAGEAVRVEERKRSGGRLVIRLDRPVPRGTPLEIPREELPEPAEGEYYVFQLVGLEVEEEGGRRLGVALELARGGLREGVVAALLAEAADAQAKVAG